MPPTPNGEVHPVAALFPPMTDAALDDLAASIATHGLTTKIVLDPAGVRLDGGNRLRACERKGIPPTFTVYDGPDPVGFILSANLDRRHSSEGQRAMTIIAANAISQQLGNPVRASRLALARQYGVSRTLLDQAQAVQDWAPELVPQVLAGASLTEASGEARTRQRGGAPAAATDAAQAAPTPPAAPADGGLPLPKPVAAAPVPAPPSGPALLQGLAEAAPAVRLEVAQQLLADAAFADAVVSTHEGRLHLYDALDRHSHKAELEREAKRAADPVTRAIDEQRALLQLDKVLGHFARDIGALVPQLPPYGDGGPLGGDFFMQQNLTAAQEALDQIKRYVERGRTDLDAFLEDVLREGHDQ
jgi:hypothetical protein